MASKSGETPDAILKKLRRLDSNMVCPNCGTPGQRGIGFGNVCVKFSTFVCDLCKTSHQAISHQVKSITMSNWTMEEVNKLMDHRGGGNAAAQHIWLGNAPAYGQRYAGGQRPKQGDKVEIFKQFVLDAYAYGKFRAETPYVPGASAAAPAATAAPAVAAAAAPRSATSSSRASPVPSGHVPSMAVPSASSSSANFTADFDFLSSDGASGNTSPIPSRPATSRNAPTSDPFLADFGQFDAFTPASAPAAPASSLASSRTTSSSNFAPSMAVPPPVTTSHKAAVSALTSSTTASSASLLDLLDDSPALTPTAAGGSAGRSGNVSPIPVQHPNHSASAHFLQQQHHQHTAPSLPQPPVARSSAPLPLPVAAAAPVADVFDPFGSSSAAPLVAAPVSSSSSSSSTITASTKSQAAVLDLFQGLSFDAPASTAPVMMGGASAAPQPVML
eukprot:gene12778-14707_t